MLEAVALGERAREVVVADCAGREQLLLGRRPRGARGDRLADAVASQRPSSTMTSVRKRGPPDRCLGFVIPSQPSRSSGGRLTSVSGRDDAAAPSSSAGSVERWGRSSRSRVGNGRASRRGRPRSRSRRGTSARLGERAPPAHRRPARRARVLRARAPCRRAGRPGPPPSRTCRSHRAGAAVP